MFRKFISFLLVFVSIPTVSYAAQNPFGELEAVLPRLERTLELCEDIGIDTSYEDVNIQVISDYIDYGKQIYQNDKSKARYILNSLEKIADDTEKALNSYVTGEKTPYSSVRFTGGEIETNGYSFIANTNKGVRPVFFNGYNNAGADIDVLDKYGVNLIQIEMGPYHYIVSPTETSWKLEGSGESVKHNSDEFYSGGYCLEVKNSDDNPIMFYQDIALEAGSYAIKCYLKGSQIDGGILYGTTTDANKVKSFPTSKDTWSSSSYNFTLRTKQTVRVGFLLASGTIYLDEFTVKKSEIDYAKQGGFEEDFVYPVSAEESEIGIAHGLSSERYFKSVKPIFEEAAEKNIMVDFIISPHYFPDFIKNAGASVEWTTDNATFLNYDIYSDLSKKTIEEYLKFILPKIADEPSLFSICLTNEPEFQIAYVKDFFVKHPEIKEKWIEYLEGRYENIEELNLLYEKNYSDFSDVELNLGANKVQYYDTNIFNSCMLSEWHTWLAELVRKYAPGIPIHTKQMQSYSNQDGMHPEKAVVGGYADLGGNDAHNVFDSSIEAPVNKIMWYDFVGSFNEVPVFNSENHMIYDTGIGYSPYRKELIQHIRTDLWQGAIHGRSANIIWAWEKSVDDNHIFYDSFGSRPEAVAEAARTTMDLNRLSDIVSAIQNNEANIGILYSEASEIYDDLYHKELRELYRKINESGQRVKFVSERQIQSGSELKMILIPNYANYVEENTVEALNTYIGEGGFVIAHENSLMYNTKSQPNTKTLSNNAIRVNGDSDIYDCYLEYLKNMGLDNVIIKENENRAENIDWKSAQKDGKTYINLCNTTTATKFVSVYLDGTQVSDAKDLITENFVNPSNLELLPFTPVLLEVGCTDSIFVSGLSVLSETNSCTITWKNNSDVQKQLSLYDGDELLVSKNVSNEESSIDFSGLEAGKKYKAVISCSAEKREVEFYTKRNKNTSSFINGWTLEYRGQDEYIFDEGEFAIVSNEAHGGNSSLRLNMYNAKLPFRYFQLWRDIYLSEGSTYRYSLWYKTDGYDMNNQSKLNFVVSADGGNNIVENIIRTSDGVWNSPEGQWHELVFDYTPTSSKNHRFYITAECGGTIWFDDISVYKISNGTISGENLLKKTSTKIGGDFEDESFKTIPNPIENIKYDFLGGRELKFSWVNNSDVKKVNIYRDEELLCVSVDDDISVYSEPYETWTYSFAAVDENENESDRVTISSSNMGNVTIPVFYQNGNVVESLENGVLKVQGYSYEDARLILAIYNNDVLESVIMDSGRGWLSAELNVGDAQNRKAVAYFWQDMKPLRCISEIK